MVKILNSDGQLLVEVPGDTLKNAMLANSYLRDADLSYTDLRNADLRDANLTGACLTGSKLDEAKFSNADLTGAECRKASFRSVNLDLATLTKADFSDSDFQGASLIDASMEDAKFEGCQFTEAKIKTRDAFNCSFANAVLTGCGEIEIYSKYLDFRGVKAWTGSNIRIWGYQERKNRQFHDQNFAWQYNFYDLAHYQGPRVDEHTEWNFGVPLREFELNNLVKIVLALGAIFYCLTLSFAASAKIAGVIGMFAAALHLFVVIQTNRNFQAHPSKFIADGGHRIYPGLYSMFFCTKANNIAL